jgi:CRISPR-associated protein Cas6
LTVDLKDRMNLHSHIDLAFPVLGRTIPRDHGYALYGALSRLIPAVHGATWIGIHGIAAKLARPEELALEPMGMLRIRVPTEKIGGLLALAGATLEVAGRRICVGAPTVHALIPAAALDARLVVIRFTGGISKPFDREAFDKRFIAEAQRQLLEHEIRGDLELCGRQNLSVGAQRVIGHSVRVLGLSPDDSLKLQIHGLGGKRTMGCGVFRPSRPPRVPHAQPMAAGAEESATVLERERG